MNEINIEDIKRLKDLQLSQLLHHLIGLEADKYQLQEFERSVPFNITSADGGSDGRAIWNGNPETTRWLKNKFTIFQNKATDLMPSLCADEILEPEKKNVKRKLKEQIEKLVKSNGCYILFTNKPIVDNGKDNRIKGFRDAIKIAGEANYATFHIEVYDANSIKDWVNEYISAVTLVQGFNGIHRPDGFRTWEEWEIFSRANQNTFKLDDIVRNNISLINLIDEKKSIRITGHSGLGKTRLALEAFRESLTQKAVVYYDLEGNENIAVIKNYIISHQDSQNGIIVIDNCDARSHNILSNTISPTSKIKIITIGLDDNNSIEDLKIKIERDKQRDLVREIVQNKIGYTHNVSDIEYINTISEGYPSMAIKFCDIVLKDGMSELHKIPLDEFTRKLIFGNGVENDIEYGVVRACSVFSSFGFLDDSFREVINTEVKESLRAQMDFIRTRIYDGDITSTKFREICTKFLKLDIIERRGIYYVVKPTLLAINLAADWLLHTDADQIIIIIKELKNVGLDEKFVDRLKDLDQIDKAKDIVAELWGPNSPFGSAEVLNTSWGSQLFRYVVEVNPIITAKALESSFGKMSKQEIYSIDIGRRNLVWSLEKLCFRKESFDTAVKILYSFAVSENETWGNNSISQFKQLFQLFLSGTEVSLNNRLKILKWGLEKNDDDYTKIAIEAMGRALIVDNFIRLGGSEKQGNNAPLQDYHPSQEEIHIYWIQIMEMLTSVACSNNINANLAKDKIAKSIRGLSRIGELTLIINSIREIIEFKDEIWSEALNNLKMTLSYETHLSHMDKEQINSLIDDLSPRDLKNQLLIKVIKPEWEPFERDEEDEYLDKPKLNAQNLALEIINNNLKWELYLDDLLQGDQRQTFNFGQKIGELTVDKKNLIINILERLKEIPQESQNLDLLAGILSNPEDKRLAESIIDDFLLDSNMMRHAFYLTRVINPSLIDIEKLFILVDNHNFSIYQFKNFQYGMILDHLNVDEMLRLCKKISLYANAGKWTALSLVYMYCRGDNQRWDNCKSFLKDLISSGNMTIDNDSTGQLEGYYWSETVRRILSENKVKEFAVVITKQIIDFCSQRNFNYSFDSYISNVLSLLFEKYFKDVWDYIGTGIIGDYTTYFHLESLVGSKNGSLAGREGMLFLNPQNYDFILGWCRHYPDIAPKRLARLMPLSILRNEEVVWHPFSKAILDEFGYDEKVLSELSANIGTFGTIGSRVPYFETIKLLLEELIDHPIQQVKDWAVQMLEYNALDIKREKLDDEQWI